MLEQDELRVLIEHEKKNLLFYALFFDSLCRRMPVRELERNIDFHLDRLIDLFRQLKG
jgi:hypothetical protein